jgi:hypothetical protein
LIENIAVRPDRHGEGIGGVTSIGRLTLNVTAAGSMR